MARGELLPDHCVANIVEEGPRQPDTRLGVVLDGFPGSRDQIPLLREMLRRPGDDVDVVSAFEVPDHVIVARLLARGRPAETGEAIQWRLQVYRERTGSVLDCFRHRGLLEVIDGVGTPEEVAERLFGVLARRGFLRPR